jgi:hypothetical protein
MNIIFDIQGRPKFTELRQRLNKELCTGAHGEGTFRIVHRDEYDADSCRQWIEAAERGDATLFVTGYPPRLRTRLRESVSSFDGRLPARWHVFRCPVSETPVPRIEMRLERFLRVISSIDPRQRVPWSDLYEQVDRAELLTAYLWCLAHCRGAKPHSLARIAEVTRSLEYAREYVNRTLVEFGEVDRLRSIKWQDVREGATTSSCRVVEAIEYLLYWPLPETVERVREAICHNQLQEGKQLGQVLDFLDKTGDIAACDTLMQSIASDTQWILTNARAAFAPQALMKASTAHNAPSSWQEQLLAAIPQDSCPIDFAPITRALDHWNELRSRLRFANPSTNNPIPLVGELRRAALALKSALENEHFLVR